MKYSIGKKYKLFILALLVFLLIVILFSFTIGRYSSMDIMTTIQILIKRIFNIGNITWTHNQEIVMMQLRAPRILGCILIGAALAVSGASYQVLFSNPMASADTLGVSNAASFGAVLGIILGMKSGEFKILAFVMGILAVSAVFLIAAKVNKGQNLTIYLLLNGMIISSVFSSLLAILKYIADPNDQLPQITYWLMGSMSKISFIDIGQYLGFFIIGITPLFLLRWRMNLLSLNDGEARSMGVNVFFLKTVIIICATLLTASSTAITGGIAWIGLIIPHVVRMIVGSDFTKILPVSALVGACFLLIMDDLSRCITINELPISIMTSLIGAPMFFAILFVNTRRRGKLWE